jgi:hypothetical protein
MKRDALRLSQQQFIETGRDWNGRYFIAYSGGTSVFIREIAELRRFLSLPKGLPMRESLESWLSSLADMDAKRRGDVPAPLGDAQVEGSFDPLAHGLDESDPQFNTKTVI